MKKYQNSSKEETSISESRTINPSEWNNYHNRIYKINQETHSKFISSAKNSIEVKVK